MHEIAVNPALIKYTYIDIKKSYCTYRNLLWHAPVWIYSDTSIKKEKKRVSDIDILNCWQEMNIIS